MIRRPVSTSVTAPLTICSVLVTDPGQQSIRVPVTITRRKTIETKALIDCGAQGVFIDRDFVDKHNIPTAPLKEPIDAKNVDGTQNKAGKITHFTWLDTTIGGHTRKTRFLIAGLGNDHMILGLPWLRVMDPKIGWASGRIKIDPTKIKRTVSYVLRRDIEMKQLKVKEPKPPEPIPDEQTVRFLDPDEFNEIPETDLIYAYTKDEPVIGILQTKESPLTREYDGPKYYYNRQTKKIASTREYA